jgi:DNA-binding response OmpR family regulator
MIVLTSRADELDRVRVFDRGGDDVVTKPFSYPELRARVAAVLRRAERQRHPRTIRVGALEIDLSARAARVRGSQLRLSAKEYALLVGLARDPHRVFTKAELLRDVWGYRTPSRTVDSHASRLRQKLASEGERLVINVWGAGYCLAPDWRDDDEVAS